jgi:hypothetical protein
MGKLINGPQGQVIGLVGNNISYMLNNQNVTRIKSSRKILFKNLSPLQQANCHKLSVINSFLKDKLPLLKAGFGNKALGTTKNYYNFAMSYNKLNALKGVFPYFEIEYSKITISAGELPMPQSATAIMSDGGIEISWLYASGDDSTCGNDQTIILLHFPALEDSISIVYGVERRTKRQFIELLEDYHGAHIECYLSFVSADRTLVSTSKYLGRIN